MTRAILVLTLLLSGCIHYVDSECKQCRVLNEDHDEDGTHLVIRAPASVLARLRSELATQ